MSNKEPKVDLNITKPTLVKDDVVSDNKEQKSLPERIPAFGILMAVLGVVCFSLGSVLVKILHSKDKKLHSLEILVFRCLFQLIVYIIIILIFKLPIFGNPGFRWTLFFRCVSGTVSLTTIYMAYIMMPLADASTIHFSSPVFVTGIAYFMLKEPVIILECVTGVITILGVVIISKPGFIFGSEDEEVHEDRVFGTVLAVTAAITTALSMVILRKLKTTSASVIIMWYSGMVVVVSIFILIVLNAITWPTGLYTWSLLFVVGLLGVGDQFFMTISFHYEKAGPISVARTFNIVLSFIWGVVFLREEIEWTSILGATLISSCVIILAAVKWKSENPQSFDNLYNKLFCCSFLRRKNVKQIPEPNKKSDKTINQNTPESANVAIK